MKTIKNVTYSLILLFSFMGYAQDYYSIHVEATNTDYNYPKNIIMTLIDENGTREKVQGDTYVQVEGNYTLEIKNAWSTQPELLKSEGKKLRISKIDSDYEYSHEYDATNYSSNYEDKPVLISKEVVKSGKNNKRFDLYTTFSNGLSFTIIDGKGTATLDKRKLPIKNGYLVDTPEGRLKISFRVRTGEMWYVFEKIK